METPDTWVVVQNDGSFWVGELANNRALHFAATGDYLGQFSFMRFLYMVAVDHNAPSRVFRRLAGVLCGLQRRHSNGRSGHPYGGGRGRWDFAE